MRFFVSRRRYDMDLGAARAEADRLRTERDDARTERSAFKSAAQISARQFTEADATNRRLSGRISELGRRLSQLGESDPEYAAALEARIARLLKVIDRIAGAGLIEHRRANHLQERLDQYLGLDAPPVLAKARRQPPAVKETTP